MIEALRIIAERKIAEAVKNGDLQIEGWRGKALPAGDNQLVPEDLRMAYKILKNSGYLPPEVEIRIEIKQLEELIANNKDEKIKIRQLKKLNYLTIKLNSLRQKPINLEHDETYLNKVIDRLNVK